jgi:transposase
VLQSEPVSEILPDDVAALKRLLVEREAELAAAKAELSHTRALIELLKLRIAQAKNERFGQKSERSRRLAKMIEQMELELENLEATATEDEIAAEEAAKKAGRDTTMLVAAHTRRKPVRKPFPEHLPRKRIVLEPPAACPCCGGAKLSKIGEAVTETLEVIPREWFVKQIVREKFSCRDCERFSETPAPFHAIARGHAGPSLLAMVLYEKFGCHQPLNRQSERYALEGIDLSVSTLADHVGACTASLAPLVELIRAHVLAAERLHTDDTTVPVLAKGKTITGRIWTYVRDDRPFGGADPPAAVFYYSRDRGGEHPQAHLADYAGILQADAFSGYVALYEAGRKPGPIFEAGCYAHARRKYFKDAELALKRKLPASPLALEAVRRIDELFDIEREINGRSAAERLAVRKERSAPLMKDMHDWMRAERAKLSRHADTAKAFDYMLKRWDAFTRFLHDGRICLSNNAAERAVRGVALGRKSWLFAGSDRGGVRAADMLTLIHTAKLNDIDPQAWLADLLDRIADHPAQRLHELLPWNWKAANTHDVKQNQIAART